MKSNFKGKKILVTGGTGSIGSALVKKSLELGAKNVKVFSNDENGLYELEQIYNQNKKLQFLIGDIRDEDRINNIVKGTDIIFHAAALKHVDRCEFNPYEAITVNINGTKNIISSSIREKVKNVILISTDKAVNPFGVMGATKLLGEKLMAAEGFYTNTTIFASVRFGNVLHSRGSILPLVEKQIERGGPITLTDKRMKRYFLSINEAVDLIISAEQLAKGGETFVLKMPIIRLEDLFEAMKEVLAPKFGFKPSEIKTKIIGVKPGEKLIEDLLSNYEMETVLETRDFFIIPPYFEGVKDLRYTGTIKSKDPQNYFKKLKPLKKEKILRLLKSIY